MSFTVHDVDEVFLSHSFVMRKSGFNEWGEPIFKSVCRKCGKTTGAIYESGEMCQSSESSESSSTSSVTSLPT